MIGLGGRVVLVRYSPQSTRVTVEGCFTATPNSPSEVPVADADTPREGGRGSGMPLETTGFDWREQRQTVLAEPELEKPEQEG
ncbi:MAG: hypothetical protein JOZ00_04245 [Mycobacterium sp.]|uniref:hypothetical protein n=1 Tax=Mycobacterium sp. TaxID=1785 RepID=UPI001EB54F39|nr:hypothetical protein [Mycobacterium sp.]MBV8785880.1 hypothetical protein [Mycobacterium sp.]